MAKNKRKILKGRARRAAIMHLACQYETEGQLELDATAEISEGDDNGAYVQMWQWVEFKNTSLCKGEGSSDEGKVDGDHEDCDDGCPVIDALDQEAV